MSITEHQNFFYNQREYNLVYNERLADKIRTILSNRKVLTEKKMFGGIAFLLNDYMCCGVINDDLMVRVGGNRYKEALELPYSRPMDFTGRPTTGFVFVGSKGWSKEPILKKWVHMGVDYVSSLPRKSGRKDRN
jgi:TfoX/Sxy family transcriptional regulator of competence genes